jgi:hypothetical protein
MDCFVGAADIVVCPYHSEAQITVGFKYRPEQREGHRFHSIPACQGSAGRRAGPVGERQRPGSHVRSGPAPGGIILKERQTLAEKAYALGRQMGWSNVSKQYLKTFADVMVKGYRNPCAAGNNEHPVWCSR